VVLAGPDEHVLVEADVGIGESVSIAEMACGPHVGNELAKYGEVVVDQLGCCASEGVPLDDDANRNENLLDLFLRHLGNDRAPVGVADDQSLLLELTQRVAYRLLARAQLPGQLKLDEPLCRLITAAGDGLPERGRDSVSARAGVQRRENWSAFCLHVPITSG
jgi:hypothetical protein